MSSITSGVIRRSYILQQNSSTGKLHSVIIWLNSCLMAMKPASVSQRKCVTLQFPLRVGLFLCVSATSSISGASGSGITLYGPVIYAATLSASIDGGTPTYHHFDGVWNCCVGGIEPAYNFTLYNIQSLSRGFHSLVVTLLNSTGGYPSPDYHASSLTIPPSTKRIRVPL